MAILESEMVQMDEIFLPYMLSSSGQTVSDGSDRRHRGADNSVWRM